MLTSKDLTLILQLLEGTPQTVESSTLKQKILQQLTMIVSYDLECG